MLDHIKIAKVEKVQLLSALSLRAKKQGTICLTTTHLIFIADDDEQELWLLHSLIGSLERGSLTASGCTIIIKCKHFLSLTLTIGRDRDCQAVYETLTFFNNIEDVHAFTFTPTAREHPPRVTGWHFDLQQEYERMRIPTEKWVISDFNIHYSYCDTYPEYLVVPTCSSKRTLIGSSKFRSRNRLPVLTYYYARSGAAICRCSQPLAGLRARCEEDEQMVADLATATTSGEKSRGQNVIYVIDTRPLVNTMVNRAQGKGTESERHYVNIRHHMYDIENIHVMRNSLAKFVEVSQKVQIPMASYLAAIDSSGWLRHIRVIMECARFVADSVRQGITCVIHCSDGWDRTAQTCALAQIMLEPYYRTFDGLRALIEKDWLAFGHKFTDRCGHAGTIAGPTAGDTSDSKEISPVFTQFLDCVWQLQRQYPSAFEYDDRLLIELQEHAYSCLYGTFLGNCDKDRRDLRLSERTYSVWPYLEARRHKHINPHYDADQAPDFLQADVRMQSIGLWRALYNRFDDPLRPRESLRDATCRAYTYRVIEQHQNGHAKLPPPPTEWQLNTINCTVCGRCTVDSLHRSNCCACGRQCCHNCVVSLRQWRPNAAVSASVKHLLTYCQKCRDAYDTKA